MSTDFKYDREYLDSESEIRGTKMIDLLVNAIDFSKVLRYFPIPDDLKRVILYITATDTTDEGYRALREALLLSGQIDVVRYIENDITCKPNYTPLKIMYRIVIPIEMRNWLMFKIVLDCGLTQLLLDYGVIFEKEYEVLSDQDILECNRVDILLSELVPHMTNLQFRNLKRALTFNLQWHIAKILDG